MSWKNDYNSGIQLIDSQHEELLNAVNQFIVVIEGGSCTFAEKKEIFEEIFHSFMEHCRTEEQILKKLKYPDVEDHILSHERLRLKGQRILDLREAESDREEQFIEYVMYELIIKHMVTEDARYFPLTRNIKTKNS